MRSHNRKNNTLRPIIVEKNFLNNALGSCLIKVGNTHVICSATLDEFVPHFLKGSNSGWLSAEYCMLPTSCEQRDTTKASLLASQIPVLATANLGRLRACRTAKQKTRRHLPSC
jgi:ribonuclease PH